MTGMNMEARGPGNCLRKEGGISVMFRVFCYDNNNLNFLLSLQLLIFPAVYNLTMQHNIFLFSTKSIWIREWKGSNFVLARLESYLSTHWEANICRMHTFQVSF